LIRSAIHQSASLLLTYPDHRWPERLDLVRTALRELPGDQAELLSRFCAGVADLAPLDLAAEYVATFDRSRRRTLYLTYYTDGDTRRRGGSLARMKSVYRQHGWQPPMGELPDFLPAVLEFAARCPEPGQRILAAHRPALDLLLRGLGAHRSRYANVLRAIRDTLPEPTPAERAAGRQLTAHAVPFETVGLEPFSRQAGPSPEGHRR
jgi:nitrate reductase delta subunit